MLVPDSSAYNDSQTAVFRELASDNTQPDHFAYIDASLQWKYLSPLNPPGSGIDCLNKVPSRPVSADNKSFR